jgi:polyisoprenoid-binding protein YceI
MKKTLIIAGVIIIAGIAAYLYATQAPKAPSAPVEKIAAQEGGTEARFVIDKTRSSASFSIKETLRGSPFTVVGTTNEIGGTFTYALGEGSLKLDNVLVNTRTLKTDSTQRDGAISRLILKSGEAANEFIVFSPRSVLRDGDGYLVSGDLTISGVTKPVTFDVDLTTITEREISGTAKATLSRADFGLIIPSIPFVADVPDTFEISASIVAAR